MPRLQGQGRALLRLLILCFLAVAGCTTQTYYREDGAKVTVEKFAGIPYLEKEESTKVVPPGSE
jgi:hypothetical protein